VDAVGSFYTDLIRGVAQPPLRTAETAPWTFGTALAFLGRREEVGMKLWSKVGVASLVGLFAGAAGANAGIIGHEVFAGVEIRYDPGPVVDGTAGGSATESVEAIVVGPVTGASISSHLWFTGLGLESLVLNFDLAYDGAGYDGTGYMGESSPGANKGTFSYQAVGNTELAYAWDFDYLGPQPFGLQIVRVFRDGAEIKRLGDYGKIGHHEGMDSLFLLGGSTYDFEVLFQPNVWGAIGVVDGELVGSMSFDFESVPEPATTGLVGAGLLALALVRRRRSQLRGRSSPLGIRSGPELTSRRSPCKMRPSCRLHFLVGWSG
jgi:hypothetical protein